MDPEFGCEHLRPILEKNDKATASFYRSYLRVHRARAIRNKKLLANSSSSSSSSSAKARGLALLKPSYACLHCSFVASRSERDAHAKKFGHRFFVDSRTREVYCQRCHDFVYDFNLERFLTSPYSSPILSSSANKDGGGSSKPGNNSDQAATSQNPTEIDEEDAAYIASNTTKRSCGREGVRGLYNLGQTCYMNVILQTLLHDGFLTTYFLGNGHKTFECTDEHCVSCALCETFAEFNNDENTGSICSLNVLHASWVASPEQLGGNQQQDAHEFYQFLVDRLHCAAVSASPENKSCDSDCTCFFHKAFFGKLRSSVTCLKCGNVTRKDDPIMDLSLAFQTQNRHDTKAKGSSSSSSSSSAAGAANTVTATGAAAAAAASASTTRTLTGCLDSFTAPENLTYSCSRCGDVPQQATKQLQIGRLPLILCIQLKRFERTPTTTEKVQGKIDFPLSINMKPYTTSASSSSEHFIYDLSSAIVHTGTTVDSGHYYAYCRQGEQWFLFNDDKVLQVSIADVLNANAYLLFYTVRSLSGPKAALKDLK